MSKVVEEAPKAVEAPLSAVIPTAPLEPIKQKDLTPKNPHLGAQLTEHHLAQNPTTLPNIMKPTEHVGTQMSPQVREAMELDSRMVRGKFIFIEAPKNKLKFPYKKYPGQPVKTYEFEDGEIVTIPLGVAKHLNSLSVDEYDFKPDAKGNPVNTKVGKRHRCSFQSMEFVDQEPTYTLAGKGNI